MGWIWCNKPVFSELLAKLTDSLQGQGKSFSPSP
jgi:hypothetical protein